ARVFSPCFFVSVHNLMNSDSDTDSNFDLVVIGGGAAGFFAAITCTELSEKPRRILILEKGSDGEIFSPERFSGERRHV
ncbi:NAD(P)/FAD-dependent oxidoreductase, partial [Verrucomicrobiales bacterium]|nr:NAD(P)/FAD-dependent oxidoreductase [Verrucomicrobiales bacterium]